MCVLYSKFEWDTRFYIKLRYQPCILCRICRTDKHMQTIKWLETCTSAYTERSYRLCQANPGVGQNVSFKINMNTFTHKTTKPILILNSCNVFRCYSWCIVWNRHCHNYSCFVAGWAHVIKASVSLNFVTSRYVVLFWNYLSRCVSLNASPTAADDYDAK
jgi:hypothetical protein